MLREHDDFGRVLDNDVVLSGRYRIVKLLGGGGMGAVYEAINLKLDLVVALKTIHVDFSDEGAHVARFIQEGKAIARARHPNIVRVFDADMHALEAGHQLPFVAMEFLYGQTLADIMQEGSRMSLERVAELLVPIADALAAVHGFDIVHRDVKPSNVYVCTSPNSDRLVPKLVDFGIAKFLAIDGEDSSNLKLTKTGHMLGSAYYMAPEQMRLAKAVGPAADQFSFGVMLFEALVGKLPFPGNVITEIYHNIEATTPSSLRRMLSNAGVPPVLQEVVLRTISKDPEKRYGSMTEVASALRTCLGGANDGGFGRSVTSVWLGGLLGIAGIVSLIIAVAVLLWRERHTVVMSPIRIEVPSGTCLTPSANSHAHLEVIQNLPSAAPSASSLVLGGAGPTFVPTNTAPSTPPSARPSSRRSPLASHEEDMGQIVVRYGTAAGETARPLVVIPQESIQELPDRLSRQQIHSVMVQLTTAVRACVDNGTGTATIAMVVEGSGRVQSANVSGPFDGSKNECIAGVVRRAQFPAFARPTLPFVYPFVLSAPGD